MDIVQRQGNYPPPPGASQILGVEVSGIVEAVGKNGKSIILLNFMLDIPRSDLVSINQSIVKCFKPGDAVFGLMGGGGYAEVSNKCNHFCQYSLNKLLLLCSMQ